jgi:hypothetical protein
MSEADTAEKATKTEDAAAENTVHHFGNISLGGSTIEVRLIRISCARRYLFPILVFLIFF